MLYGRVPWYDGPVSRIVQGLSVADTAAEARIPDLLDEVYALGCNAFDMAHQYRDGAVERQVGRWLATRGQRKKVFIITKGAHHNADRKRVTPHDIDSDLYDSLARLKIDTIDLYLLHRDNPAVPVGPIVEKLNEHQSAGRVRAFGASNWSTARIAEANAYAQSHGLKGFAAGSPHFSLAAQVEPPWADCITISGPAEQAARDWYTRAGLPLFVWSSMAGGFFSGRFRRDNLASFAGENDRLAVRSYGVEDNFRRLDRVQELATKRGLSIPQVALAYVLNHPLQIFALIGHQSGAELQVNLAACAQKLSEVEMAWLDLRDA
ncbi:MAG: aldo/keto reductase [Chloroflexi bacterium]|nr:aldo/keto reductase [Chloroflexota bacterium]